jgi:hypothetical protein
MAWLAAETRPRLRNGLGLAGRCCLPAAAVLEAEVVTADLLWQTAAALAFGVGGDQADNWPRRTGRGSHEVKLSETTRTRSRRAELPRDTSSRSRTEAIREINSVRAGGTRAGAVRC